MCKCICKNCGRYFLYGDCQSPMLSNKRWKEVVQFYNLSKYEKEAIERYDEHLLRAGWRAKEIENEHLYLCYKCIEEALGRKIRRSDLIGKNIPINKDFEEMYFNK